MIYVPPKKRVRVTYPSVAKLDPEIVECYDFTVSDGTLVFYKDGATFRVVRFWQDATVLHDEA